MAVTGDLTQFAEIPEFEAAAAWLARIERPKLVCPGNHDAPYLAWAERLFAPFRRYEKAIGVAAVQTYLADGLAVRGVNTAREAQPRLNWSKGQIAKRQVREAVTWFETAPQDAVRIVSSPPPADRDGGRTDDGAGLGRTIRRRSTSPAPAWISCCQATSMHPSSGPIRAGTDAPMAWAPARCRSMSERRRAARGST